MASFETKYSHSMTEKGSRGEQLPIGEIALQNTPQPEAAADKGESVVCRSAPVDLPPHMKVIRFELKVIVVLVILIYMCWKRHARIISAIYTGTGSHTPTNTTLLKDHRRHSYFSLESCPSKTM